MTASENNKPRRIIVCGGRDFSDRAFVMSKLEEILNPECDLLPPGDICIVHGGCPTGVDSIADDWAVCNWVMVEVNCANWAEFGRAAGPKRNQEMADRGAELCIAFPGGKGTADMVRRAKAAGIPVMEVEP